MVGIRQYVSVLPVICICLYWSVLVCIGMYSMYLKYWYVLTSIGMYRKNYEYVLYVCGMYRYICYYWLVSIHNTRQILAQYIPVHTAIHANTYRKKPVPWTNLILVCIWNVSGMYRGKYWHVMGSIWYVMACIEFRLMTRVFAPRDCIGIYCRLYWHVLGTYRHALNRNTCWSESRGRYCKKYCGVYWVCIGMYW